MALWKNVIKRTCSGILFSLLVIIFAGMIGFNDRVVFRNQASAASYYGSDSSIPDFPEQGTKGTSDNPFVILEIVPYEGYAEIGYMISGCEPIPLNQLTFDNTAGGLLASTKGLNYEWKAEYTTTLGKGDVIGNGAGQWQSIGNGTYQRYRNYFTSSNSFLIYALEVPEAKLSDYKIQVVTVTPDILNNPANYRLINRADLIYLSPKSHYGSSMITLWEKYHPDKKILNGPTNFYSNDLTWEATVKILEKTVVSDDPAPVVFDVTTFSTDLSYNGQIEPKKYYSTGALVSGLGAMGYTSNTAKLYLIMQLMDPAKFYHEFIEAGRVKSMKVKDAAGNPMIKNGIVMTTGYYLEQAVGSSTDYYKKGTVDPAAVWNIYTLLPYQLFKEYASLNGNKAFEALGYRIFTYDGDKTHTSVRHNLYAYNGDNSITQIFFDYNISENYYNEEAFDYYNTIRGARPVGITPAEAICYLLQIHKPVYGQTQLRILEIEPCNDFIWDGSEYARQYFAKFCPHFTGSLQVTTMTSQEFIGKVENLNSHYDMVFFGLKDGLMRKDTSGVTSYNDTTLNGKVYLHTGDKVQTKSYLRGVFGDTDIIDDYRFAGNDITAVKLGELKSFMAAGYPVVLGNGFLTDTGTLNTVKIDSTSQIYQLATSASTCLYYADTMNTTSLEGSLSAPKCKIVFGKKDGSVSEKDCYPAVYQDKTKNAGLTDADIYINGINSSNRTLSYRFYITDNSSAAKAYAVSLYIDINADGKFDPTTETIYGISIRSGDGYATDSESLKADTDYNLTLELDNSFSGVLPWKLEIKEASNPSNNYSVINYSALKVEESSKIHLNILQIKSTTGNNVDLANNMLFKLYTQNLNDYVLHFKSITVSDFEALCGTGAYHYILKDSSETMNEDKNADGIYVWDDYDKDGGLDVDMLILGFADLYSDISNSNALHNIEDYIDEGKAVLFTHDTTSFANLPKDKFTGSSYWGYHLNKEFRDVFGMDRFGVTGYSTKEERIAAGKDYTSDQYIQGYTDACLNRFAVTGQYYSNTNFPDDRDIVEEYVTNLNQGQITRYPYQIDSSFKVAKTHAQYYQLDMESHDIVVWYCLSDNSKDALGKGNGTYSTTPNDARNNYYIYNKGNITYSGVGHSAIAQDVNNAGAVMETKLFVNTIIAAYSQAVKEPVIEIMNSNKSTDESGMDYIYVDYDIYETDKSYGTDLNSSGQKIKYQIIDNNILYNKKLTVKYYYLNPDTGVETAASFTTRKEASGSSVTELQNKTGYYIEVPLGDLDYKNRGSTVIIRVTLTYGKQSSYSITFDKKFTLVRRGLFDLE